VSQSDPEHHRSFLDVAFDGPYLSVGREKAKVGEDEPECAGSCGIMCI
jgi:hypothetical protein